jgi:hypothetical protein
MSGGSDLSLRSLQALVFRKPRVDAERCHRIGQALGVHGAFCGPGARMRPSEERRIAERRHASEHDLRGDEIEELPGKTAAGRARKSPLKIAVTKPASCSTRRSDLPK